MPHSWGMVQKTFLDPKLCLLSLFCLSCTARHSFLKEKQWCYTSSRDLCKDTLLRLEEEKSPHPAGIEPVASLFWGVRSTTVLQTLPKSSKILAYFRNNVSKWAPSHLGKVKTLFHRINNWPTDRLQIAECRWCVAKTVRPKSSTTVLTIVQVW